MPSQASINLIQQVYVSYLGRPGDKEGLKFWAEEFEKSNSLEAIFSHFSAQPEFLAVYGTAIDAKDNGALLQQLYMQMFGRTADLDNPQDGGYWLPLLNNGTIGIANVAFALVRAATENPSNTDGQTLANKFTTANAITAAVEDNTKVYGKAEQEAASTLLSTVKSDAALTGAALNLVLAWDAASSTIDPTDPTDGQTFRLTASADRGADFTGTSANDKFVADLTQNQFMGGIANTLSSADSLDGAGGRNTLNATLVREFIGSSLDGSNDIRPATKNIQEVYIEAVDLAGGVTLNASRMENVAQFWSDKSDANLRINNVNLTGDNLSITKDVTFALKDTASGAGLRASFETSSLLAAPATNVNSQVLIRIADVSTATPAEPLKNVSVDLGFSLGGTVYKIEDVVSTDGSYSGLVTAIQNALVAQGLATLNVALGNTYNSVTVGGNTVNLEFIAQEILITDPAGKAFSAINFTPKNLLPVDGGFIVAGNAQAVDPSSTSNLIESNVILDNAGRGSWAGVVQIGGDSGSPVDVEKFNITVERDSKIDALQNGTNVPNIKIVDITSGAKYMKGDKEVNGDLAIGRLLNAIQFDTTATSGVTAINANTFEGAKLALGNVTAGALSQVVGAQQINAVISGDVTLNADTSVKKAAYSYNTGAGNDRVDVLLRGDAVDTAGTSFALNTGAGNDVVNITMTAGVSQQTMTELENLNINLGAGNDTLNLNAYGNFSIDAGAGDDFVRINSVGDNGDATITGLTFGNATGPQAFGERVLYQAELTLTFAGFERTVDVVTTSANNFKATQVDINLAIINAIDSDPVLSQLLTYTVGTGNQSLTVTPTVGGANSFAIALYQPELVANNATDGQVVLSTTDLASIRTGLVDTTAGNSDIFDTIANIVTWTTTPANFWFGSVDNTGTGNTTTYIYIENDVNMVRGDAGVAVADQDIFDLAGAGLFQNYATLGTDAGVGVNFSTVNPGTGNDVVVFHSNDASANVLEITGAFGSVNVVNFHNVATHLVDDASVGAAQMGLHAIDFTSILDNATDTSTNVTGNTNSAVRVATTLNVVNGEESLLNLSAVAGSTNNAVANSVNTIRFDSTVSANQTFAGLTATNLVAALNNAANTGTSNYANLTAATLSPVVTADLVGTSQKHIIMVENDLNQGEYKVFSVSSTLITNGTAINQNAANVNQFDTTATLLGTMDFGSSINFQLVGNGVYESYLEQLTKALDEGRAFFSYDSNGDGTLDATVETPIEADDIKIGSIGEVEAFTAAKTFVDAAPATFTSEEFDIALAGDEILVNVNENVIVTLSFAENAWTVTDIAGAAPTQEQLETWSFEVNVAGEASTITITNNDADFTVNSIVLVEGDANAEPVVVEITVDGLDQPVTTDNFIAEGTLNTVSFDLAEPVADDADFYIDYTFTLTVGEVEIDAVLGQSVTAPANAATFLAQQFTASDSEALEGLTFNANGTNLVVTYGEDANNFEITLSGIPTADIVVDQPII